VFYAIDTPYFNAHMIPDLSYDLICLVMEGTSEPIFMFKGALVPVSSALFLLGYVHLPPPLPMLIAMFPLATILLAVVVSAIDT
jgi:hypothetical protein